MPTYSFRNTETNAIFDVVMKMSEYDSYIATNPKHERYHDTPIPVGDPVRLGIRKMDTGFKEVLQKIKQTTSYADFDRSSSQI